MKSKPHRHDSQSLASSQMERFRSMAAELLSYRVDVLVGKILPEAIDELLEEQAEEGTEKYHYCEATEFQLWAALYEDEDTLRSLHLSVAREALADEVLDSVRTMVEDSQNWLHRKHGSNELTLVSLATWKSIYDRWKVDTLALIHTETRQQEAAKPAVNKPSN